MPAMQTRVTTNLGQLARDIGTYMGIAEGIEQKEYVKDMVQDAHRATVPDFVKAAASSAVRFNFAHMYEYGVTGITRGNKRFISPTSPTARLWQDVIIGNGRNQLITFVYREAVNRVPPHTEEETGVDQEILDKLKVNQGKRYVFRQKAEIIEEGIDVHIHPLNRQGAIFIPLRKEHIRATPREISRGYAFRKSVRLNTGRDTDAQGQFSNFFFTWWGSTGGNLITEYMERQVNSDIARATADITDRKGDMKSPQQTNVKREAASAAARVRKQWTVKARRERIGGRDESEVIF